MKKMTSAILTTLLLTACGAPQVVELTPATELNPGESVPVAEEEQAAGEAPARQPGPEAYSITISNLSGKDLKELSISFVNTEYTSRQILSERLNDGTAIAYKDNSLAAFGGREPLVLQLSAIATDGTELSFPTLTIYDLTDCSVVLGSAKEGFTTELY